jgi:MoxR-like ATPase
MSRFNPDGGHPAAIALRRAVAQAGHGLVERDVLVDLLVLAAVSGEHVLVVGPPGTAKSEAVRRVAMALGGRFFEYLVGKFTEPSELFGPVNLGRLRDGFVETDVAGMLPEAEIAFLDEVFNGSTAILNTLLGILNERAFVRGHTRIRCPLRLCVGASNSLPTDEALAAFADRFLIRTFVEPVPDELLETLLAAGRGLDSRVGAAGDASMGAVDIVADVARRVDLGPVVADVSDVVRTLRRGGIVLSDRRIVRSQRLIAAAAAVAGRDHATRADLWPLVFVVPTAAEQAAACELLGSRLDLTDNDILAAAAEAASQSPAARARRWASAGELLLAEASSSGTLSPAVAGDMATMRLRIEAWLRTVDGGLASEARPAELNQIRDRLIATIGQG